MLTEAEREASLETIGAFISGVHAHLVSRMKGGDNAAENDGPDPRVRDFLEKTFGPGYERLPRAAYATVSVRPNAAEPRPRGQTTSQFDTNVERFTFTAEDLVKDLPAEYQKLFLEMPADERNFLLTMETHYRQPYSGMTLDDQAFFRSASATERNAFITMSNEERAFFRKLDPLMHPFYLVLGSGNRALFRRLSGEELEKLTSAAKEEIAANASKPAIEVARELTPRIIGKEATAETRQATQRIVVNFLTEHPGDQRTAYLGALCNLLQANEAFLDGLLREAGSELMKLQAEAGGADLVGYQMKARHWLPALALQLVHPQVTREELVSGIARVVLAGAKFTETYLPQKAATTASNPLQFRRPIIG